MFIVLIIVSLSFYEGNRAKVINDHFNNPLALVPLALVPDDEIRDVHNNSSQFKSILLVLPKYYLPFRVYPPYALVSPDSISSHGGEFAGRCPSRPNAASLLAPHLELQRGPHVVRCTL